MEITAGELNRRIVIEEAVKNRDASNAEIVTWRAAYKRWAKRQDSSPVQQAMPQETVRSFDTVWLLRSDSQSEQIRPDTHRVRYEDAVFRIVGISEGSSEFGGIRLLTSSRPESQLTGG